jgi:hypothetical protein
MDQPVGTVDDIVERCPPFMELGYRHLIFGIPAAYDEETMTSLATEVRPRLEELIRGSPIIADGASSARHGCADQARRQHLESIH